MPRDSRTRLLTNGSGAVGAVDDPCTAYEERAAILEHEARFSRREAEWKARQLLTLMASGETKTWDEEARRKTR